jgi:hypothetical protein
VEYLVAGGCSSLVVGATKTSAPGGWFRAAAAVAQSSVAYSLSYSEDQGRTLDQGRR